MSPHLTVCGVDELAPLFEDQDPGGPAITHVISLWDPPTKPDHEKEITRHLDLFTRSLPESSVLPLSFDDIPCPVPGLTEPGINHMREVLAFAEKAVEEQGENTHLLVHCRMGISRSSACALAILADNNADTPSHELLSQLLTRRRWISPNQRLTLFADQLLDRDDPLLPVVISHQTSL